MTAPESSPKPAAAAIALKYCVLAHGHSHSKNELHICDSEQERNILTQKLIYGNAVSGLDEQSQWAKFAEELRETGSIEFEGDPGIEWFTANVEAAAIQRGDGQTSGDRIIAEVKASISKRIVHLENPPAVSPQLAETARDKECRRLMLEELKWVLGRFEVEARWLGHETPPAETSGATLKKRLFDVLVPTLSAITGDLSDDTLVSMVQQRMNELETSNLAITANKNAGAEWKNKYNEAIAELNAVRAAGADGIDRKLALQLFQAGYDSGHHDTVEGHFHDDPLGTDTEYFHSERVTEIAGTAAKSTPGVDADRRCESGCKSAVLGFDSEGTPLCGECLADLTNDCTAQATRMRWLLSQVTRCVPIFAPAWSETLLYKQCLDASQLRAKLRALKQDGAGKAGI